LKVDVGSAAVGSAPAALRGQVETALDLSTYWKVTPSCGIASSAMRRAALTCQLSVNVPSGKRASARQADKSTASSA
jgi:hypothetical protein